MTGYPLAALGVALAAAVTFASVQSARLSAVQTKVDDLRADVAEAEAERDQAIAGANELSRFVREQRNRDRTTRPVLDAIQSGDFDNADAPLDPDLQRLLDCLRTGSIDCPFVPD